MQKIQLKSIENSIVLVKVCYDLSNFEDTDRIQDSFQTIHNLVSQGNKVLILSHWKRPDGQPNKDLSLEKMLPVIIKILGHQVEFLDQFELGFKQTKEIINHSNSQIFLLENTRFESRENSKDQALRFDLAKEYSTLGNYFVDEAFAVSHREEATNTELAHILPNALGISYQNEVQNLLNLMHNPKRPFIAVMAGAKLETKLPLIEKMLMVADKIIIGGLLAFTFIKAGQNLELEGFDQIDIADSKIETEFLPKAEKVLRENSHKIILPVDFVYEEVEDKKLALDIGKNTITKFIAELEQAKTVFMNGTMGYYEKPPFDQGTLEIANYLSQKTEKFVAIGGGDTNSALPVSIQSKYDYVSMGGGATLEFLSGGINYQKSQLK
jgi:phosphoglycerate kinase